MSCLLALLTQQQEVLGSSGSSSIGIILLALKDSSCIPKGQLLVTCIDTFCSEDCLCHSQLQSSNYLLWSLVETNHRLLKDHVLWVTTQGVLLIYWICLDFPGTETLVQSLLYNSIQMWLYRIFWALALRSWPLLAIFYWLPVPL